jgi:hypothetical protein
MVGPPIKIGSFEYLAYQDRTSAGMGELFQKDGSPFILGPNDQLRFKMGRGQDIPLILDLLSGSPTAANSYVRIVSAGDLGSPPDIPITPAKYEVQFAQDDITNVTPGAYDGEVSVVRFDQMRPTGYITLAEQGVVHVIATMGGNVGIT